jgi:hypothetical protein
MTKHQGIAAVIGVVFLVAAFIFLYRQFSMSDGTREKNTPMSPITSSNVPPANIPAPNTPPPIQTAPETPDAMVDDVLLNDADVSALDEEAAGETQSAEESVQAIDDITNTYEAQPY